jgi:ABC-type antimicrobial peptide transport system permease subunit
VLIYSLLLAWHYTGGGFVMLKNFFKTAIRHLRRDKVHSFINIAGLSVGMAVAMLIGLWIWDELSFNKEYSNYERIAKVMQHVTIQGQINTYSALPYVTADGLRKKYGSDFKYITMSSWVNDHILAAGDKKVSMSGSYTEPEVTDMLSLKMLRGGRNALQDQHSIILSASTAQALFGGSDPMGRTATIDNKFNVKVAGVYEDLPYKSNFGDLNFIAPWKLFMDNSFWLEKYSKPWSNNSFQVFAQIADNADMERVSGKIRNMKKHESKEPSDQHAVLFLQPMRKWHLYEDFNNGVNTGGRIEFVWLFGTIGFFVLLLACINFMNLSTARSEKRAREVGIRKAIGSLRGQLIRLFYGESLFAVLIALVGALLLMAIALPWFNEVADKRMHIPWGRPWFWAAVLVFCCITGLIAGSYPALYLSSFRPVKVLKGTFRAGRLASLPRRVLVVVQFSISIILIISTIILYQQLQFAKDRPVGYDRGGVVSIPVMTEEIHNHFDIVRAELIGSGAVEEIAESNSAATEMDEYDKGWEWPGLGHPLEADLGVVWVSPEYGKAIGWKIKEGSDFSRARIRDSNSIILNESAAQFMRLKDPVGKLIRWNSRSYEVVGVAGDMVMQSPFAPVYPTVFIMDAGAQPVIDVRLGTAMGTHAALDKIEAVFKRYNPAQPFAYRFVDDEYAQKFGYEESIGTLSGVFALLAIFISCLGLFGMASFMAEQRTKEIGVRKVLGASVWRLWRLLSKEFVVLVVISLLIAIPLAWYYMSNWLQRYEYRTSMSWWIFALSAAGAMVITLATVSYQSMRAAMANPVTSLRSE